MSFHTYQVYRDGTHTCICVAIERKYTYYIPMEPHVVRVAKATHEEFRADYDRLYTEYPVRRAAEIYLAAPDKEVTPEARQHLEAILADPAYEYDRSAYSTPHVIQEKLMAKKNAAAVAEEIAQKPKNKKEALAQAGEASSKPVGEVKAPKGAAAKAEPAAKTAPAKKAPKAAAAEGDAPKAKGGRAPAVGGDVKLKVGNTESAKRGFMLEFVTRAAELEKASRGKGFTGDALVESLVERHEDERAADAAWVRTYVSYSLAEKRGILVLASA
jgi:hypothetical protein